MKAQRLAESGCLVGVVVGMVLANQTEGPIRLLGIGMSIGSALWYFKVGQWLTGWAGPPRPVLEESVRRAQETVNAMEHGSMPNDHASRYRAERRLADARQKLAEFDAAQREAGGR